ncbi:nicotinamide-nucleotide amidohydrolase family protein [Saxibacter everestensis]|uniref:Nicotinamide-nucleotide amidohydrolase family protein n=1 Tax=Saxibacter everestensis TaxID=2909229 RepID=A0ABY8QWE0_9MICO|nr:nicotinamide-nucleotide amidohydrolase family protein [Brevibacteriaceae bacterium ZFBP1038]
MPDSTPQASATIALLRERGLTVAVAESLTGGLLASRLIDVAGASQAVLGGIVAYATDVKARVLGVDAGLLARNGAVDPEVARQMAQGVRLALGADIGVSTTGVAGPEPQDGQPVGTVFIGLADSLGVHAAELGLEGSRARIRTETVDQAIRLLAGHLRTPSD